VFIYRGDDDAPPALARPVRRRWHAVAIVGTAEACAAAKACKDNRFLSVDAPRLPLAGCDARCCDCRYTHFDDRRRGARRAEERTGAPKKRVNAEQRKRSGRRATDLGTN
jgi:hypothetical protein